MRPPPIEDPTMHTADHIFALLEGRFLMTDEQRDMVREVVEATVEYVTQMVIIEREECARLAEEWGRREDWTNESKTAFVPGADHGERFASSGIAEKIRARGA